MVPKTAEPCEQFIRVGQLIRDIANYSANGIAIGKYASRPDFDFVGYIDRQRPKAPLDMFMVGNASLFKIIKWAYANDEFAILQQVEAFMLSDLMAEYLTEYMLLHLADRYNFPRLRMKCLSSLRSVEDIQYFKQDDNYRLHLSSIDRQLVEAREAYFQAWADANQPVPSCYYRYDAHSDCSFEETMAERYLSVVADENNNGDDIGGVIYGFEF
ncbi:hypothetical protein PFISCL1PPCAC_4188 [Pristionchus fissidentatus]|uniref:BTB domain-containing protein n=1 Tax=Pristionchus fissidentatus TaxID=1538716 RepID=A0AAV5V2B4_9BILA|nr:hypothetical protein PFISCL1PPCAC_4188 [Pristionchus fissidentatus]